MTQKNTLPNTYHFWQIHKKVYNREWLMLDWYTRKQILADTAGDIAGRFHAYIAELAVEFYNDESSNYNSRFRFQYDQYV